MQKQNERSRESQRKIDVIPCPRVFLLELHSRIQFDHTVSFRRRDTLIDLFFPKCVAEMLSKYSESYKTWFLNCDEGESARNKDFSEIVSNNPFKIVSETKDKVSSFFSDPNVHYSEKELTMFLSGIRDQIMIFQYCHKETEKEHLRDLFQICIDIDWQLFIAKTIISLSLGKFATFNLLNNIWSNNEMGHSIFSDSLRPDMSISERIRVILYQHRYGDADVKATAYESMYDLATKSRYPTSLEDVFVLFTFGKWQYYGEGCIQNQVAGLDNIKRSCSSDKYINYEAHLFLARYYRDNSSPIEANTHLLTAVSGGHVDALREYAIALFNGDSNYACEKDYSFAIHYLQSALKATNITAERAVICYYCGRIIEERDGTLSEEAQNWYEKAAIYGDYDAKHRLKQERWKKWAATNAADRTDIFVSGSICVANGTLGLNQQFLDSLPDKKNWNIHLLSPQTDELVPKVIDDVFQVFNKQSTVYPLLIISLLSDDEDYNIQCATDLLIHLYEDVALVLSDTNARAALMDNVTLYIKARSEYAALPIDALISSMDEGIYFKTVFIDYPLDCARQLLVQHPVFLPSIKSKDSRSSIVVIGGETIGLSLIKEVLSCANGNMSNPLGLQNHKTSISVIGQNAMIIRDKLFYDCPGLQQEMERKGRKAIQISLDFSADKDIKSPDIWKTISGSGANYYVVDIGTDADNLLFATQLRSNLLKADGTFTNLPVIAALCRSEKTAMLSQAYTVGSLESGYEWYNNYGIITFGSEQSLYSFSALINNPLFCRAEAAHCYYSLVSNNETQKGTADDEAIQKDAVRRDLKAYYSKHYFRDSSIAEAIGILYRAFSAGVISDDWSADRSDAFERLADSFALWFEKNRENVSTKLGEAEHLRWCGYMLAHGWQKATAEQVIEYMSLGNPKQQCFVCKLHPYLCSWNDLDKTHELLLKYAKSDETKAKLATPKDYDIKSVEKTALILRQAKALLYTK